MSLLDDVHAAAQSFGILNGHKGKPDAKWWGEFCASATTKPAVKSFLASNPAAVAMVRSARKVVQAAPQSSVYSPAVNATSLSTFGRPLRIGIATPCFFFGGVERWISTLARNLDTDSCAITKVFVTNPHSIDPRAVCWLPRWTELLEISGPVQPDGVDALITWGQADLAGRIKRVQKAGLPVFDVQHGVYLTKTWQRKLVDQAVAARRLGVHLVAVNDLCRGNFPPELRDQITVIPNGTDPADVIPLADRESTLRLAGVDPASKVVLFCGRVSKEKNVHCLVEALDHLPPEWSLVIVGPDRRAITKGHPRCHVVPAQWHVGKWLGAADVACQPSQYESHCFAVNEAWLAGVPVVSTDHPVNWEFCRHGNIIRMVGLRRFVEGPDPRELARAIVELGREGRDSNRTRTAKRIAERFYTARVMAKGWERLLAGVQTGVHTKRKN